MSNIRYMELVENDLYVNGPHSYFVPYDANTFPRELIRELDEMLDDEMCDFFDFRVGDPCLTEACVDALIERNKYGYVNDRMGSYYYAASDELLDPETVRKFIKFLPRMLEDGKFDGWHDGDIDFSVPEGLSTPLDSESEYYSESESDSAKTI